MNRRNHVHAILSFIAVDDRFEYAKIVMVEKDVYMYMSTQFIFETLVKGFLKSVKSVQQQENF